MVRIDISWLFLEGKSSNAFPSGPVCCCFGARQEASSITALSRQGEAIRQGQVQGRVVCVRCFAVQNTRTWNVPQTRAKIECGVVYCIKLDFCCEDECPRLRAGKQTQFWRLVVLFCHVFCRGQSQTHVVWIGNSENRKGIFGSWIRLRSFVLNGIDSLQVSRTAFCFVRVVGKELQVILKLQWLDCCWADLWKIRAKLCVLQICTQNIFVLWKCIFCIGCLASPFCKPNQIDFGVGLWDLCVVTDCNSETVVGVSDDPP